MPINLPQEIYTGGAERFNPQQGVNLYAQLMARKQARDDAFGEYVRNLNKTINPAGLRNQERPIFDKKLADWQKYGMENREDIQKRNGGADMIFHQGYQDILNLVAESKAEEEKKKPAIEIILDPNKRDRLRVPKENMEEELKDPTLTTQLHLHDEPLYIMKPDGSIERNYDRRPLDYSSVEFNPKPFEQDKYFKQFEDIKKSDLPPVVVKDPKTLTQSVTTTSVFKPEDKEIIATRAAMDYIQNPAFREALKGVKPEQYNDFFKENYGRNIETQEDLAAAFTLKGLQQKTIKSEYKEDKLAMDERNFEQQKYLKAYEHALKQGDEEQAGKWVDGYLNSKKQEAKRTPVTLQFGVGSGWEIPMDVNLRKAFTADVDGKKFTPDKLVLTDDDKYVPVYYKYNKDGLVEKDNKNGLPVVDYSLTVPHTQADVKVAMGVKAGMKQMNIEMGGGVTKTKTVESYSKSELKSAGWTDAQIKEAIKAGKIKLK